MHLLSFIKKLTGSDLLPLQGHTPYPGKEREFDAVAGH